ncbi:MAG: MgtC/SapB family protein [Candidatus Acidiferrales bacterium]
MLFDLSSVVVFKLLLAAVLGSGIGVERALRGKPSGMRTCMFITVGACLYTLLSLGSSQAHGGDPARIAAQIIPGIGFIGAGAIIRERGGVTGLTTAATIFILASIGMATGTGQYATAIFATLLAFSGLVGLGWFEDRAGISMRTVTFRLTTLDAENTLRQAHEILDELKIPMQNFRIQRFGNESVIEFDAEVSRPHQQKAVLRLSALQAKCEVVPLASVHE